MTDPAASPPSRDPAGEPPAADATGDADADGDAATSPARGDESEGGTPDGGSSASASTAASSSSSSPSSSSATSSPPAPDPDPGSSAAAGGDALVDEAWVVLVDLARVAAAVAVLGATMWAVTGVWPPLVAVESESMSPNMRTGDLVVVTATDRYAPSTADEAGVVTAASAAPDGYRRFGRSGDVVVFAVPDRGGSPIIHRARFHVAAGENWYARADPALLPAGYDDCGDLPNCPAPHAGYVTKGDYNDYYDQAGSVPPVRAEWIRAKAAVRVPWLGWVRLLIGGRL